MSVPLDRPAPPGDVFQCETHVGALLVIDVLEHVPPMQTRVSEKPSDAIRANVYVITPQATVAETFVNTLLFPRLLVARLQQSVGRKVVGLLTGQPGVKRDGRNVPYDLDDPNDAMYEAASRAMTQLAMTQAPPPQAANGWGQQQGPPPGWGQPQNTAPWGQQQPQQGPPPGWGQPAQPQGPPPGWGAPPAQQQPAAGPWGQQAAPDAQWGQQQLPAAQQSERPPWETDPAAAPPWGGQQ